MAKCTNFKLVGGQIEMPKALREREWGGGVHLPIVGWVGGHPSRLWVWGSIVSSPSGVRGRAPTENEFWRILEFEKKHT